MEQTERNRLYIAWKNYSHSGWYQLAEAMSVLGSRIICSETKGEP